MTDIILPAHDTPATELTPIVLEALEKGATSCPHDATHIVLRFEDGRVAAGFRTRFAKITGEAEAEGETE